MKFSAKAILEYLENQEVKTEEDYEKVLQFIKQAASDAKAEREKRKAEKKEAKPTIKEKAQALLASIEEERKDDNDLLQEAMADPIGNSVRIADIINDLHYLKGKQEGIEELIN